MNISEFEKISGELRKLVQKIPLNWGSVQNNRMDDRVNDFDIDSYNALEVAISNLSERLQNYHRRRWYLLKCAECDEYLFYKNPDVKHNPNRYDKDWDIRINKDGQQYEFDIKGTVIPREMRGDVQNLIKDPLPMIQFYYDKQSRGRRYDMQNRLFIVHHSFVSENRELYLRSAWNTKEKIYKQFIDNISSMKIYEYGGCMATVIFICEEALGSARGILPQ